ncbi:MAG: hypothetical protein V2I43_16690 [Parvularcula sp.]|jgi:hypothetical protein|nr:hypothetical protein [Parvularcula sp.]
MLEAAQHTSGRADRQFAARLLGTRGRQVFRSFSSALLVFASAAMLGSVALLSYETLGGGGAAVGERPAFEFRDLRSRYVRSSEGPALELSGLLANAGEVELEPEVLLQIAGRRVAIEEPLTLGGAMLPPGAERPFTVRLLLPEGTETVSLLPPTEGSRYRRSMSLVSPAWTAGAESP